MHKHNKPLFKIGDLVYVAPKRKIYEIGEPEPRYNGYVWMYSFKGEEFSCGEIYLTKVQKED